MVKRAMSNVLSPVFIIGKIRIDQIEGASCFNMGNNWPTNFRSYKKHNQGFGSVSGDNNVVRGARSLLNDPDSFDMLSVADTDVPNWIKSLLSQSEEVDDSFSKDSRRAVDSI